MKNKLAIISIMSFAILTLRLGGCVKEEVKPVNLTVSVGMSLKSAMLEIKEVYNQQDSHVTINYNFANSGTIQQAIEQGAKTDIFISGGTKFIDALQVGGFVVEDTRKNILSNKVVLISQKNAKNISSFQDLTKPQVKKIAVANPKTSVSGGYAMEVLTSFGILNQLNRKVVFLTTGTEVVNSVESAKADAGIAYATDAILSDKVGVLAIAPTKYHSPIIYTVVLIKGSQNIPEAKKFTEFIQSDQAQAVFVKYGFAILTNDQ